MNFVYYLFLLLLIFASIFILKKNLKISPKKIKIYLSLVIIFSLSRNIGLLLLCILKSSNLIYYLKLVIFLNHLLNPLMILVITYIYLRAETLKFTINYIIAIVISIIYFLIMSVSNIILQVSSVYGFILSINKETVLFLFSLILLGIILILNVIVVEKQFTNKFGIWTTITTIFIVMIEEVVVLGGIKVFPYPIIGDLIILITLNLALSGFKKLKIK